MEKLHAPRRLIRLRLNSLQRLHGMIRGKLGGFIILSIRDMVVTACQPGTSWQEDCNTCDCSEDGEAACTMEACPSQTQYLPIIAEGQTQGNRYLQSLPTLYHTN